MKKFEKCGLRGYRMENRDNSAFLRDLKEWNLELSEQQIYQLEKYYEMLVEKNKVMNLTAITEYEEVCSSDL